LDLNSKAVICALASALLFGISTPAAKLLLGSVHPAILAGLLYCGAGVGIAISRQVIALTGQGTREVPLSRQELPWLAAAVCAGGIAGPLFLMAGLARTGAATSSLLLTLEGAATAIIAWFIFHENFDRRIALGMAFLVTGAATLGWAGTPSLDSVAAPLLIVAACLAWGLDNNLTRKVSLSDPMQIVQIKGLVAGPFNLALGLALGGQMPAVPVSVVACFVGLIGYGISLALFVFALRGLGTARTGAYFSTAPFFGATVAVIALGEPLTAQLAMAGLLMAVGVWLHLSEHHEHTHTHEPMEHAHPHTHDEHHGHAHELGDPSGEPHTHAHKHAPLIHSHPHTPDMHHAHRHSRLRSMLGEGGVEDD
jgi:drug/metabolite transporter (DMT)-like permease